ncbi:uncharacterized protein N7498_006948 [Penicillium cinerascens]|uniref:Uncharacterized protein n=1 Tax=Penicillium cinerascens TaxID=70096 RepID=A0A9W9MCA1_9EURO|nr:uncharacterized protein N7498_006948 [Penicillium cinerascens]KAJ5197831.1 hypothetical protein N7498_006948 [Penicillium cinerascens]
MSESHSSSSSSSSSRSSYYYSSINTNDGNTTTGRRHATTSYTDKDGATVVRTATQELGQPAIVEERRYDRTGQEQLILESPDLGGTLAGGVKRITDLDEEDASGLDITNAYGGPAQLIDESTSYDLETNPFGTKIYDRDSGAYDEHMDYDTAAGTNHHREARDASGRLFHQDLKVESSGPEKVAREHREYENPNTGVRVERDEDVDISDLI